MCSNAATSIAISMAHQVQMLSLHFDELSKTQQKCQQVEHGQMYTLKECNAHVFGCFSVCVQMPQHPLPFPWLIRCKCFRFFLTNSATLSRSVIVANMMQRTELRTDCSHFCLFLCVSSNAATSIAISMSANAFASF